MNDFEMILVVEQTHSTQNHEFTIKNEDVANIFQLPKLQTKATTTAPSLV